MEFIEDAELEPITFHPCERCGHNVVGSGSYATPCRAGNCQEIRCGGCHHHWAGFGPVGCPCQFRDPKLRRMRARYRAKRGRSW